MGEIGRRAGWARLIAAAAGAVAAFGACGAMAEALRIGVEAAYPPFSFINDNGEVDGFERDLGDELCRRAGLDCVWVKNDWESIIPNLVSGNYDAVIAAMTITPARERVIAFTHEYYPPDPSVYMAMDGAGHEVRQGVVAAAATSVQAAYIVDSGATLVEFPSWDDTIAALNNGEVDAVLADKGFLEDVARGTDLAYAFIGEELQIGGGMGIGLRKSDQELKARLDAGLNEMKADGTLEDLIGRWFDDHDASEE
ncbi:MAG: transporter substrate-binding domain-containing protein [Pikeienuella sp.]